VYELKFVFHVSAVLSSVPVGEQRKLLGTRSTHRRVRDVAGIRPDVRAGALTSSWRAVTDKINVGVLDVRRYRRRRRSGRRPTTSSPPSSGVFG